MRPRPLRKITPARLRSLVALAALFTGLWPSAGAMGAQTYSMAPTFAAQNQAIWGTGVLPTFSYDRYFTQSWNSSGQAGGYDDPCIDFGLLGSACLGTFGASVSGSSSGQIGIGFHARAHSGTVSLNYPITIHLTYPDNGTLYPGDTFQVSASYAPGAATLTTQTPSMDGWVDTPFAFNANVNANAEAFGGNIFGGNVINFGFDVDPTLLDTDWLLRASPFASFILNYLLQKETAQILSYKLQALNLNLSGGPTGTGLTLRATGQDDFLKLKADLTNMIIDILIELDSGGASEAEKAAESGTSAKIGTFLRDQILFNKDIDAGGFHLHKEIADLVADCSLGFSQTVSFTPTPTIALMLSTGQLVVLHGTTPVAVTMPTPPPGAASNVLAVTPMAISLADNSLTNAAGMVVTPGINFTPLDLTFGGSVAGQSLGNSSFVPTSTINLFQTAIHELPSQTSFALGGLNTVGMQSPFNVAGYVYPKPSISLTGGLSPAAVGPSNVGSTLTVTGSGFVPIHGSNPGTTILINGAPHATTFTDASHVSATLTAADVAGDSQVAVRNPAPGGGLSNAVRLSAPGPVASWGANGSGQLGNGNTTDSAFPVAVGGLTAPGQTVAAGANHSLALLSDFTVWAWGANAHGQLGNNSTAASSAPVQVQGTLNGTTDTSYLAGKTTAIAAGGDHSVVQVNTPGTRNLGLVWDGTFIPYAVDGSYFGGVGDTAYLVAGNWAWGTPNGWPNGYNYPNGNPTTWSWGANGSGQLGDSTSSDRTAATGMLRTTTPQTFRLIAQDSQGYPNLTLPPLSTIESRWPHEHIIGPGDTGVIETCCNVPPTQPFLDWLAANATGYTLKSFADYFEDAIQTAAGDNYTLLLQNAGGQGVVYGTGDNSNGQFGRGNTTSSNLPSAAFGSVRPIRAIAAGGHHSLVMRSSDGTVWAAGKNNHGQLGNNSTTDSATPVPVSGLSGNLLALVGGEGFSLALKADPANPGTGTVYAWGDNTHGQLGQGDTTDRHVATQIVDTDLTHVVAIAAGADHALALKDDGTVWAWGKNDHGQLGDGTTIERHIPVRVNGTMGISAIAAGGDHSVAIGRIDATTPASAASISPAPGSPDPQRRQWNNTAVTVTLQGSDPGGLGVSQIIYSATGAQPIASTTASGDTVSVPITAEGDTILAFHAIGINGKVEPAGNTVTVHIDKTAPTISFGTPTSTGAITNGWYPGPVSIAVTTGDAGSGVASAVASSPFTLGSSGTLSFSAARTGTAATVTATDYAGNVTTATTPIILIDTQAPSTTATLAPGADASGWNTGDVMVRLRAVDDLSGVAGITYSGTGAQAFGAATTPAGSADAAAIPITPEGVTTITYHASDQAGHTEANHSVTVKIDKTAPTLTTSVAPAPGSSGWNSGAVTVTAQASDGAGGSGLSTLTYSATGAQSIPATAASGGSASVNVSGDGTTVVTFIATDGAGNQVVKAVPVHADSSTPTLAADAQTADGAAYMAGAWTSQNVTVTFQAGAPSGIAGVTATATTPAGSGPVALQTDPSGTYGNGRVFTTLSTEGGNQSVTAIATSDAGTASAPVSFGPVRIDRSAPMTTAAPSGTGSSGWFQGTVNVTLSASDLSQADGAPGSGVATTYYQLDGGATQTYTAPFPVTNDGVHTVVCWSVDRVGNVEAQHSTSFHIVSLPPMVTPSAMPVSSQYSDAIPALSVTAQDPAAPLAASTTWSADGTNFQAGLPLGLSLTSQGSTAGSASWSLGGQALQGVGTYTVKVTVTDAAGLPTTTTLPSITTTPEDALVTLPSSNPQAVPVSASGGTANSITLTAAIAEVADGSPGDISTAVSTGVPATVTLVPIGPGTAIQAQITGLGTGTFSNGVSGSCTASVSQGVLNLSCTFLNVPVNVYTVQVAAGGNYRGSAESGLSVYDPSLGGANGGGTVIYGGVPANFGFTAKYLKSGQIQGSLLFIEHQATGDVMLKSNAMGTLAIVKNASGTGSTAVLTGKATLNGAGSYTFTVTAADNGEPGKNDQFGLQVKDSTGAVVTGLSFVPVTLTGGNIQVH